MLIFPKIISSNQQQSIKNHYRFLFIDDCYRRFAGTCGEPLRTSAWEAKARPDMKVFPLQVQMGNDPVQPQMSK